MIERARDADVPCSWVLGDGIYGSGRRLRMRLGAREQSFVLAVCGNEKLWPVPDGRMGQHAASASAAAVAAESRHRLGAGPGARGERLCDWARVRLVGLQEPPWDHWRLIRRSRKDPGELAISVVFGPADPSLATLARVDGGICMSNNAAERALRGIAVGPGNWTFAGSDRGAAPADRGPACGGPDRPARRRGLDGDVLQRDAVQGVADAAAGARGGLVDAAEGVSSTRRICASMCCRDAPIARSASARPRFSGSVAASIMMVICSPVVTC